MLLSAAAWADQIVLKDGTVYSGKFIRGDAKVIDFRVLGRIESFKLTDVSQIIFKEPELATPAASPSTPVQPTPPFSVAKDNKQATPQVELAPTAMAKEDILPAGTPISIRTSSAIDTDRNRVGDFFDATLEEALISGDRTIAPRGSAVKGRIAYAKESGKLTGRSELILELTELIANGKSYMLRTSDYTETGVSRGNRTAATVGGVSALGAIIGAIAGGGKGAAVGAVSGAAVGTGVQVVTKGETLKIPAETILEFRLQSPLTLSR
jgi:hypothetical protein